MLPKWQLVFGRRCVQKPIPWAMMPQSAIGAIRPPRQRSAQKDNQAEKQDRVHGQSLRRFDKRNVKRGGRFLSRDPAVAECVHLITAGWCELRMKRRLDAGLGGS